jgi:hypothetical protein
MMLQVPARGKLVYVSTLTSSNRFVALGEQGRHWCFICSVLCRMAKNIGTVRHRSITSAGMRAVISIASLCVAGQQDAAVHFSPACAKAFHRRS